MPGEELRAPTAMARGRSVWRPALAAALALFVIYAGTLAPGLTFWDAGEFIAAVQTLGIPHPPGTPLFVLAARAWREALAFLPTALATNLFSAACSAVAGGALAVLLARARVGRTAAFAGALCAGAMSSVWLNANETEVYAGSLLLSTLMLLAGERAGATGERRWLLLLAYATALAVPLHLSALVAAPAAIALAAQRQDGRVRTREAVVLVALLVGVVGAGLASAPVALVGAGALLALLVTGAADRRLVLGGVAATALALTALVVLPARAAHDPWLNSGDPVSWRALWDVVGRRQYGGTPVWPRQAPLWIQLGNWFEYADWQMALGLAPDVGPSPLRTPVTLLFAVLGVYGARAHRRIDRRSWRALLILFACASVGLVLYLNFKAGASFGFGVLPEDAPHEVRDRDYFFVLGFWTWGAWAGMGAVALVRRRMPRRAWLGVLVAALPVALNWRAVDRRAEPERSGARRLAEALLWSAPRDAVLVTAGDNDSFPLWYAQTVEEMRPDVTVVVAPLLGTAWYRSQLARRDGLLDEADVRAPWSESALLGRVAARARARGRALVVAITAGEEERRPIAAEWVADGLVYRPVSSATDAVPLGGDAPAVDTAAAARFVARFGAGADPAEERESTDPAPSAMVAYLACPAAWLRAARTGVVRSLDSRCKLR